MKRVAMKVVSLALAVALVGAVAAWAAGGHHGKGLGSGAHGDRARDYRCHHGHGAAATPRATS